MLAGEWSVQARRNGRVGGTVWEKTEGEEAQSSRGTEQAVSLTFRESFIWEIPRQQTQRRGLISENRCPEQSGQHQNHKLSVSGLLLESVSTQVTSDLRRRRHRELVVFRAGLEWRSSSELLRVTWVVAVSLAP